MEELELSEFTEKYGDEFWFQLKRKLKRDPTQYEYDNYIDKEYWKYLESIS